MRPIPLDTSTDNGAPIGWYNAETGQWDKEEPDLPAFMKENDE